MEREGPAALNPFATRYVRPGALRFSFPPGTDARSLVARLRRQLWRGQILGPHGSGKSTLLQTLIPELQEAGRDVRFAALHSGQRRWPFSSAETRTWRPETLIIVDGYEQLGWLARLRLSRLCRISRAGLLITCHRPASLPLLWQTATSLDLARELAARLLDGHQSQRVSDSGVVQAYGNCGGDLRECFFQLYDLYDAPRRQA